MKQGDTDWVNGGGTGGSRSLNMSGGALEVASEEVIRKGKSAAGQVLQAGGSDVAFEVVEGIGRFRVADSAREIGVGELAVTLKRERIPASAATQSIAQPQPPLCGYRVGLTTGRLCASVTPLRPTGRVVIFPNSVVFTGTFFKNPPEAPAS